MKLNRYLCTLAIFFMFFQGCQLEEEDAVLQGIENPQDGIGNGDTNGNGGNDGDGGNNGDETPYYGYMRVDFAGTVIFDDNITAYNGRVISNFDGNDSYTLAPFAYGLRTGTTSFGPSYYTSFSQNDEPTWCEYPHVLVSTNTENGQGPYYLSTSGSGSWIDSRTYLINLVVREVRSTSASLPSMLFGPSYNAEILYLLNVDNTNYLSCN